MTTLLNFLVSHNARIVQRALSAIILSLLVASTAMAQDQPASNKDQSADNAWSRVKFGATLEGYYEFNANRPDDRVIILRAYDTRANSFSIQQAAIVIEGATDVQHGRRFGVRLDLQFGQATETVQGNPANEPRPDVYRHVWQAYGSYVFPLGRGLQVDFGKFASILGYETNYAKDNFNFSRAYLFNFLPFYHEGVRAALPVSKKLTLIYMLTNGVQQTEDFNNFKSNHVAAIIRPVTGVTWTTSYYFGQEQPDQGRPDGPNGWFRVFDTNITVTPHAAVTLAVDISHTSNQLRTVEPSLSLDGLGAYARYQVWPATAVALRYEHLDDDGLFAAPAQRLQEATATAEHKFADGFLVRVEFRRDWSSHSFFPARAAETRRHQNTMLIGLVWWIGNKAGAW